MSARFLSLCMSLQCQVALQTQSPAPDLILSHSTIQTASVLDTRVASRGVSSVGDSEAQSMKHPAGLSMFMVYVYIYIYGLWAVSVPASGLPRPLHPGHRKLPAP